MGEIPGPSPEEQGFPEGYDPQAEAQDILKNPEEGREAAYDSAEERWSNSYQKLQESKGKIWGGLGVSAIGLPIPGIIGQQLLQNPTVREHMFHPSVGAREAAIPEVAATALDGAIFGSAVAGAIMGAYGVNRLVSGIRGMFRHSAENRQAQEDRWHYGQEQPKSYRG